MDSLSQIALGAAVSIAVFRRKQPLWQSAALGAVLGTLPDLDVLIQHGDPISDMTLHRTQSHALFYLTLLSPLLVWFWLKISDSSSSFRRALLGVWLVLITHPLLDMLTIYGTQLLLPFTDYPFGIGSVFVIDPLYTLLLLCGLIFTLLKKNPFWNQLGLMFSCGYLLFGLVAQQWVQQQVEQQLPAQQGKLLVSAAPFNTLLWRVLWVQPQQYSETYLSLLDPTQSLQWQHYPRQPELISQWQQQPQVARIAWFSHGFFQLEQQPGQLVLTDLRLGLEPGYNFRFVLTQNDQGEVTNIAQLERPPADSRSLRWLWQRMQGNTQQTLAQYLAATEATAAVTGDKAKVMQGKAAD
ncbi:metal-dependent hydrolase [Rheinheimera sp.]|uniref:metal-dependent hydrolase n=1 Tax=Rheinheimera sp. TaxID=1869214 RepID=UPI002FDE5929